MMFAVLHSKMDRLIRFFLPMECPVCGKPSADGTANGFCAECILRLEMMRAPYCPGCGGTMDGGILDMCPSCMRAESARPWKKAFSLCSMNGFGRELIHLFKYGNRPDLATPLAHLIRMRYRDEIESENFDCIVPAPLYWLRLLQRGYNQAEMLTKRLGAEFGLPSENLLRRVKWTKQQAKLSQKERILNLKGAFRVKNSIKVEKRAILLVDDVMTTGSTLAAAADVLLKAGAAKVCVLVIARR